VKGPDGLYPGEKSVETHGGISVGQSVKLTQAWLDRLALGGVRLARLSSIGLVERIIVNEKWGWDSVEVRFGDNKTEWLSTYDLRNLAHKEV